LATGCSSTTPSGQQQPTKASQSASAPSASEGAADNRCLQVRLSKVVAQAVLGASSELGGTVIALDDLWGRDAVRAQESYARPAHGNETSRSKTALARRYRQVGRPPEVGLRLGARCCQTGMPSGRAVAAEVGWKPQRRVSRFRVPDRLTPRRDRPAGPFDNAAHSSRGSQRRPGSGRKADLHRQST